LPLCMLGLLGPFDSFLSLLAAHDLSARCLSPHSLLHGLVVFSKGPGGTSPILSDHRAPKPNILTNCPILSCVCRQESGASLGFSAVVHRLKEAKKLSRETSMLSTRTPWNFVSFVQAER